MKTKTLLLSAVICNCFVLTCMAQMDSVNRKSFLQSTWIIDTTIVKHTIDGVATTKTYLVSDTAVTFVQRPQKIIITADSINFMYPCKTVSGIYTVEEDKLFTEFPTHRAEYRYILIKPDKLQLYYIARYVIDGICQAEEQCIFKGRNVQP
jgi:hypothetical protein